MAYEVKIKSIEKEWSPADDAYFLKVDYEIVEGKKVREFRSRGFDLGISEKDLKKALKKDVDLYEAEEKRAVENKEIEKKNENVLKLKKLEGTKV